MKKTIPAIMVALVVLLTGCPHNNYEVTMTSRGDVIDRTVVFYRSDDDGSSPKGPRYIPFDPDELDSISAFYTKAGLTNDGDRHTASGEFIGALPGDIGGEGWHMSLSTSLGDAGFYVERFRGNDNIAGMIVERFHAADQLTDLVIGWCNTQFISEPGFKNLHRFLDQDFRQDLKNLSLYDWIGEGLNPSDSNEEYLVRIGQYLIEREYVRAEEAPRFLREWQLDDETVLCHFLQQLIARKLGITAEQPMPLSLVFLADPEAVENSWNNYLTETNTYRKKLRIWENNKAANTQVEKPDPVSVLLDLISVLDESGNAGGQDRLIVRLALPSKPLRTNGKWDETHKQVFWESGLAEKDNISRQPVFCYADWVTPKEDFQKDHLGSVSLTGEKLLNYCLWRTGLEEKKAVEWEQFLTNLKPGVDATNKLNNFLFVGEPEQVNAKGLKRDSDIGKRLIKAALLSNR